jgi:FkbM family methyltransferase
MKAGLKAAARSLVLKFPLLARIYTSARIKPQADRKSMNLTNEFRSQALHPLKTEICGTPTTFFGITGDSYFDNLLAHIAGSQEFVSEVAKLPEAAVIVDVGANIGVTSMIASRIHQRGKVIAFEPSPKAFLCLSKTASYNNIKNCKIINKALGSQTGSISFVESEFLAGSYVAADAAEQSNAQVELTTLDAVAEELKLDRLDLLKIDVEGFELDVLLGATKTIEKFKPKIFMEFNSFAIAANRNMSPRLLIDYILDHFKSFSVSRDGKRIEIRTPKEARDFLFSNMAMLSQRVDDIVFSY